MHSSSLLAITLASLALAKTNLSGCVSSETVRYGGASLLWYVPGTGEICQALDCGGGRAPPKTTVAGCPSYEGTGTYSPSFIALATSTLTSAVASSSAVVSSAMITASPSTSSTPAAGIVVDTSASVILTGGSGNGSPTSSLGSASGTVSTSAPGASSSSGGGSFAAVSRVLVSIAGLAFLL